MESMPRWPFDGAISKGLWLGNVVKGPSLHGIKLSGGSHGWRCRRRTR